MTICLQLKRIANFIDHKNMYDIELLNKAQAHLRALEIEEALILLYRLLEAHPNDLELIGRIYPFEIRKKIMTVI